MSTAGRRLRPVVGQLGYARPGSAPSRLLERLRHPAVKTRAARRAQVVVESVVDERVGEREAAGDDSPTRSAPRPPTASSSSVEQLVLGVARHDRERAVDVEVAADHGGDARAPGAPPRRAARCGGPTTSRTLCGSPSSESSPRTVQRPLVLLGDAAGLEQVAEQLADVERVAVGLAEELLRQRLARPRRARGPPARSMISTTSGCRGPSGRSARRPARGAGRRAPRSADAHGPGRSRGRCRRSGRAVP